MSVEKKSHKAVDFIEDMNFTTDKSLIFQADEIEGSSTDCTATPDLAAFFQRRKKVDAEVVAHCEQRWQAHPLWSCAQVLAECRRRWPEPGALLSEQHMRTAGHQVGFLGIQQGLRRQ